MVIIKSKSEIEKMKEAGRITYETLKEVSKAVKPGVTTMELDKIAEDYIRLDLITATDDIEEVMSKAWTPVLDQ